MKKYFIHIIVCIIIFGIGAQLSLLKAGDLSIKEQSVLFLKIIEYNKTAIDANVDELRIGIIVSEKTPAMKAKMIEADDVFFEITQKNMKVKGKAVKYSLINFTSEAELEDQIKTLNVSAFFIVDVPESSVPEIANVAEKRDIFTFSGSKDYWSKGVAVIVQEDNSRPQIYIDTKSAKAQGADFNKALFKIAKTEF